MENDPSRFLSFRGVMKKLIDYCNGELIITVLNVLQGFRWPRWQFKLMENTRSWFTSLLSTFGKFSFVLYTKFNSQNQEISGILWNRSGAVIRASNFNRETGENFECYKRYKHKFDNVPLFRVRTCQCQAFVKGLNYSACQFWLNITVVI